MSDVEDHVLEVARVKSYALGVDAGHGKVTEVWREAVLELAQVYYDRGHELERHALGEDRLTVTGRLEWARAQEMRAAYTDLCGLVARLDPRPGAPGAPLRPW